MNDLDEFVALYARFGVKLVPEEFSEGWNVLFGYEQGSQSDEVEGNRYGSVSYTAVFDKDRKFKEHYLGLDVYSM